MRGVVVVSIVDENEIKPTYIVVCQPRRRGNGGDMSSSWQGRGDVVVTGGIFNLLKQKAEKKRHTLSYVVVVSMVVAMRSSSLSSWLVIGVVSYKEK